MILCHRTVNMFHGVTLEFGWKVIFSSDWRSSDQQDPCGYANVYATNIILHYAQLNSSEFLAILHLNLASSSSRSLSGKKLVSTSGFLPVTTSYKLSFAEKSCDKPCIQTYSHNYVKASKTSLNITLQMNTLSSHTSF